MKTMKNIIEDSLTVLLRRAALPEHGAGVSVATPPGQAGTTGHLKQLKPKSMDWTKR
jgi:hypothetical protein